MDFKLSDDGYMLFARGPMTTQSSIPDIDKHSFETASANLTSFSSCGKLWEMFL